MKALLRTPLALTILSGILFVASFPPWDLHALQWITFIPLFFAIRSIQSFKQVFMHGFVMGVILSLGGYYWIIYATQQYGGLPLPVAVLVFAFFCVIGQLQLPLYLVLRKKAQTLNFFSTRPLLWLFISGILYTGIDALYPKLFLDTAGQAFYSAPWIRQSADLGGVYLLTTFSIWVNEGLFYSFSQKKVPGAIFAAFILLFATTYGGIRFQQVKHAQENRLSESSLSLALIQANIGDFLKVRAEQGITSATEEVVNRYLHLSRFARDGAEASGVPDAIVWPETAYPGLFEQPTRNSELNAQFALKAFAQEFQGNLIFGGYDRDERDREYNSLFFYRHPQGSKSQRHTYHKSVLLMFGETLPFYESLPQLREWFPTMGFFGKGNGPESVPVLNRDGIAFQLAPSICYEGLIIDHSVDGALKGADAHINVTNDSWFGPNGEPYYHLALTTFRSIETRLPMIRSTNTGFTALIDATGEIQNRSTLGKAEVIRISVGKKPDITSPYLEVSRWLGANWYHRFCILVLMVFGVVLWTRRKIR